MHKNSLRPLAGLVCGAAIGAAVLASSAALAQESVEPLKITPELVAAAEQEGELTLQYSSPLVTMQGVVADFNEAYPNITVHLERKAGSAGAYGLLQELQSDVHRIDLFQGSDWAANRALIDADAFVAFELENQEDLQDAALVMAPHLFFPSLNTYVISYNPELVSEEEAEKLKSWKGMLDPAFKGRFSIVEPVFGVTLAPLTYLMSREDLGEDFLKAVRDQEPLIYLSTAPARDAMVSGQAPISWGAQWEAVALTTINSGAPVRFVYPEPTVEWKMSEDGAAAEQSPSSNTRSTLKTVEDTREVMKRVKASDWYDGIEESWNPSPEVMINEGTKYQEAWENIFRRGG